MLYVKQKYSIKEISLGDTDEDPNSWTFIGVCFRGFFVMVCLLWLLHSLLNSWCNSCKDFFC